MLDKLDAYSRADLLVPALKLGQRVSLFGTFFNKVRRSLFGIIGMVFCNPGIF